MNRSLAILYFLLSQHLVSCTLCGLLMPYSRDVLSTKVILILIASEVPYEHMPSKRVSEEAGALQEMWGHRLHTTDSRAGG
jgi:hypothetical protein